jgi:hypothetical protein
MRMAIVPAMSLHAEATSFFKSRPGTSRWVSWRAVPRRGYFNVARFLQLSEECRIRLNVGMKDGSYDAAKSFINRTRYVLRYKRACNRLGVSSSHHQRHHRLHGRPVF